MLNQDKKLQFITDCSGGGGDHMLKMGIGNLFPIFIWAKMATKATTTNSNFFAVFRFFPVQMANAVVGVVVGGEKSFSISSRQRTA